MADDVPPTDRRIEQAIAAILEQTSSPEAQQLRHLMMRRIALAGDVTDSRLPAPRNITELGGYLNLLESIGHTALRERMLASLLGVALPEAEHPLPAEGPPLFFAERANDRPACAQQPTFALMHTVRSDFAAALDGVTDALRRAGGALPLLAPVRRLPPAGSRAAWDALVLTGRTLELAPTAALLDPQQDPLLVAPPQVLARVAGASAPEAALTVCVQRDDGTALVEVRACAVPLAPLMAAAGWTRAAASAADWSRWTNVSGLVPGRTTLGDELSLLYSAGELAASALRERLGDVWNGRAFVAPR